MTPTREDYEAAAKAAGIVHYGEFDPHGGLKTTGGWWNPLTDDGDAFRLAAALKLSTYYFYEDTAVAARDSVRWNVEFDPEAACSEDLKLAAMREAIFMCAVLIGRAMK